MSDTKLIDTHHHLIPPGYEEYLRSQGVPAGGPPMPAWSPEAALEFMEKHAISASVLSLATGVHFGDDGAARAKAREVNEYAADAVRENPSRFGFFATVTLPDVDGALAEAAYALDTLGADGVILPANAGGAYLGDPKFDPLLAELDGRGAVVLAHPGDLPGGCGVAGIPGVVLDYLLDTTRAGFKLAASGAMDRYRNLKIILPHGGGFLPYAAYRMALPLMAGGADLDTALDTLRRFYFDTGLATSPAALPSLLAFADPDRLVHASDWPYAPEPVIGLFSTLFDSYPLEAAQRARMDHANAEELFPRLAAES